MNVYLCTDHSNYVPVSAALVVVAKDEAQARQLLNATLAELNVPLHIVERYKVELLDTEQAKAHVLYEGG